MEKTATENIRQRLKLCKEQDEFVFGDWKYGGFFGEFGNGKTTCAILRSERLTVEYPGNVGMVLRKVWSDNRDTTLKQFHEYFPQYEAYYKHSQKVHVFPNGSTIFWRGMDRVGRIQQLNNYNLGWFWLEQAEELDSMVWNILEGRLKATTVPLSGFLTANPAGHNWCWKKFVAPSKNDLYKYFQPPARWNAKNLPERYYEEKEENWPSQLVDRYLNGKHEGYEGLIYSCFTERDHVREAPKHEVWEGEYYEGQDYGVSDSNPMVWLWLWKAPSGAIYVLDEFYRTKCLPDAAASAVLAKRSVLGIDNYIKGTYGCPRTFQKEKDGKTPADLFKEKWKIHVRPNPVRFEVRFPKVFKAFDTGGLFVSENCPNLISELQGLTWENQNTAADHAIEALERVIDKMEYGAGERWAPDKHKPKHRPLAAGMRSRSF